MLALFNNMAVLHDQNQVSLADCGEPVGDDKAGAPLHHIGKGLLNADLSARINGGCSFI